MADVWSFEHRCTSVVALRTLKIAADLPMSNFARWSTKKIEASSALPALTMTGLRLTTTAAASKMLTHYRRKVRANKLGLQKGDPPSPRSSPAATFASRGKLIRQTRKRK